MSTDAAAGLFSLEPAIGTEPLRDLDPPRSALPVRLTQHGGRDDRRIVGGGTGNLVSAQGGDEPNAPEAEPDAVGRGWVTPPGGTRVEALFVLAGTSLGIGRTERVVAPVWLDLADLVNLDAIGEPSDDGLTEVEISMADGTVIGAGWTDAFCQAVVGVLTAETQALPDPAAEAGAEPFEAAAPAGPDVRFDEVVATDIERDADPVVPAEDSPAAVVPPLDTGTGVFSAQPVVRNRSRRGAEGNGSTASNGSHGSDVPSAPVAGAVEDDAVPAAPTEAAAAAGSMFGVGPSASGPAGSDAAEGAPGESRSTRADAPTAGARSGALELEDVVYIGGYPGQTRRRKKCTAVLTHEGLEVAGPGDLRFRIAWDSVKTVEAQNSDEARFRMNTKIHRDSSALVVECEQSVTILLEARDCPTIPLRSAITQLLDDLPVVVV